MKKTYQAPMASVETFGATDSYCATCYYLACDVNAANQAEKDVYKDYDAVHLCHNANECGNASHQIINDEKRTVIETSTYLGPLDCNVTGIIAPYEYVSWTTSSGSRTWHHQGYVGSLYSDHPNRS